MTPLHMAVWAQKHSDHFLLLSNKVDINVRHPSGRTALEMSKEAEHGIFLSSQEIMVAVVVNRIRRWPAKFPRSSANTARWTTAGMEPHRCHQTGNSYSRPVFGKGTNDWNHFTLLELLYFQHGIQGPLII